METNLRKEDQILMSLVHYFVTKENYSPIFVQGVKDEIWLEKLDGPYQVIRINSNRLFNDEQFKFDQFKIKDILRQIKKKTMSFTINALNINLNENSEKINTPALKNIDNISISSLEDIQKNSVILDAFPNIKGNLYTSDNGLELIYNITNDINTKTERENKKFEKLFAPKKIYVTYILIALCVLVYIAQCIWGSKLFFAYGANNIAFLKNGQIYRLITYAFLHGSIIHLFANMYSLIVVGSQVETNLGKWRLVIIYLVSAITGGLLSAAFYDAISIGASGAIFGVLGALAYFAVRFRLYIKNALKTQIIPVIILNLFLGMILTGIDVACHVGGLIGGYLTAMAVGIPTCKNKKEETNGLILLIIYTAFLSYLVFFR